MTTAADIRAEHAEAMASLTPAQWAAVDRVRMAAVMAAFSPQTTETRLDNIFEREALARDGLG